MAVNFTGLAKRDNLYHIPVSEIRVDWNDNGRSAKPTTEDLTELKASIRKHGQQQPVIVRKAKEKAGEQRAVLVAGYHRVEAIKQINEEDGTNLTVVCSVQDVNEYSAFVLNIEENLRRRNLSPVDIATQIKKLENSFGKTAEEVAEIYGRPARWVAEHKRILNLDQKTLEAVHGGRVTLRGALELVAMPEAERKEVAKQVIDPAPVEVTPDASAPAAANRNGKVGRDEVVKAARNIGMKRSRGLKDLKEVLEAVGSGSKIGQEILAYLAGDVNEESLIKTLTTK